MGEETGLDRVKVMGHGGASSEDGDALEKFNGKGSEFGWARG